MARRSGSYKNYKIFILYQGKKCKCKRFLALTNKCYDIHKNDPFFLAIHSFALELSGKKEENEEVANRALKTNIPNPSAHHALSLVYINTARIDEGIQVL